MMELWVIFHLTQLFYVTQFLKKIIIYYIYDKGENFLKGTWIDNQETSF